MAIKDSLFVKSKNNKKPSNVFEILFFDFAPKVSVILMIHSLFLIFADIR